MILCGFALYFIPLQSPAFNFDDIYSVERNEAIRHMDILKIFDAFNTRFLVGLSFALNFLFFGLNAVAYRAVNLIIHCFNAFLVYLLIKDTVELYAARKMKPACRFQWAALFGGLLFLCHPIQTEPVNFITQRFVLMGSFFYLLSLLLYIKSKDCFGAARLGPHAGHSLKLATTGGYYAGSLIAAAAAMLCKEFTITLPVMLAVYDFYFFAARPSKRLLPFFFMVLIVPLLLLKTPMEAVSVANIAHMDEQHHVDITRANQAAGRMQYFLTELNVMRTYVRLLFVPVNQNFDYDYPVTKTINGTTLLSAVFLLGLLAIAWFTYRSDRILSFGILWFFIALSVESSFIPIGHVIAEYRLYLGLAGFVLVVMMLVNRLPIEARQLNIAAIVILVAAAALAFERNMVWKSDLVLWSSVVKGSPHKSRGYNNRGVVYYKQNQFLNAIADFNKAIELDPKYADAYTNRGNAYSQTGDLSLALADFNKAISLNPNLPKPYNGRGFIYKKWGDLHKALADYTQAIKKDPGYGEAYSNRGGIEDFLGELPEAIRDCSIAMAEDPSDANAFYNRGVAYYKQGNFVMALADYNKAIELNPNFTDALNNREDIYKAQGNMSNAIPDYTHVIALNPHDATAYNNRGYIYSQQGNFTQALADFNKAIELNPKLAQEYNNRGNVYNIQNQFDQALSDYTKALELDPKYAEVYYNRGSIYDYQGKRNQALADYSKAIEINPDLAQAHYARAVIYYAMRKYDKAWADAQKAQELGFAVKAEFMDSLKKAYGR